MTVIGKTTHSLFFNGVSDSIVCPMHEFTSTGVKLSVGAEDARSSRPLVGERGEEKSYHSPRTSMVSSFSVEAWIRPDCGGVVASKEGLFKLTVGSVGSPGPAAFTVATRTRKGDVRTYTARSAQKVSGSFSGIIYPTAGQSFVSNNTELSKGGRELLHVVGMFTQRRISIYINGQLVAATKVSSGTLCEISNSDLYIGGRGGEYRGHIEAIHWRRDIDEDSISVQPFVRKSSTIGLWRFEEPVEIDETEFYIKSSVAAGDTTLTLDSTQTQSLYEIISGKSDTLSGTYNVPSLGKYRVVSATKTGGLGVIQVEHTTTNLLINPTSTDVKTGKPNSKPPERVRLKSISSTGTITVESIHLDFDKSPDSGAQGVLHARTAFDSTNNLANDSTIVLLRSDLLLDPGTGRPLQPPGLGSQAIDRNGMTAIDESINANHGFLFSRRLSVGESSNPYTISSSNWSIDDKFRLGHSGRHKYSHKAGHPYLQLFPKAQEERVTQTVDGLADAIYTIFDGQNLNLTEQVPVNSKISLHKSTTSSRGSRAITTSKATQVVRNGLSTLDPDRDGIIAIGGANFNITPFLLKGHASKGVVSTDDIYDLHMAPEDESRIAILETGDSDFPYVEIHYNAVDLTGDTIGTSGPALLVEKTVPAGGSVINSKRVAATIAGAISSGKTLHAPGGIIHVKTATFEGAETLLKDHNLIGDNTGGRQYEVELDLSMIPSNYTPQTATDGPQSPPKGVDSSHAENAAHPSVYHQLIMRSNEVASRDIPSAVDDFRLTARDGNKGPTNQSTHVFEVFDIIDNYSDNTGAYIIVQPSDRSRTLQLSKFARDSNDSSVFTIEYLMSRGRVSSFRTGRSAKGITLTMHARGLMDDIAAMSAEYLGEGAPDSTIVKEMKPDAPVVTVTLGGAGQGAVESKPTWDKSPLSRLGWSTRRDGGAIISAIDTSNRTISVTPLNNNSDALASWGTYMFPPRGRVHLKNQASAEYFQIDATKFYFSNLTTEEGTNRFVDKNGKDVASFSNWVSGNSLKVGDTILLDPLFDEASIVADGTTINDRLFQSLGSVAHDYQLGTQYASTRALVEIPLFSDQFFDNPSRGVFPGPSNSMKIHLDPTLTAHSWAPNPVGRRPMGYPPADRDAIGPYHKRWVDDDVRGSIPVTKIDKDNNKVYVDDLSKSFPTFDESISSFRDITGTRHHSGSPTTSGTTMHRRIYRPNGEWALVVTTSGEAMTVNSHSANFWEGLKNGSIISMGPHMRFTNPSIRDDPSVDTSVNEFRRPFYYDRANVQTQGGNIDYGLRQYVSAVEFKAGPTVNPHSKKIESGAATFEILAWSSPDATFVGENLPRFTGSTWDNVSMEAINQDDEILLFTHHSTDTDKITVSSGTPAVGDIYTLRGLKYSSGGTSFYFDIYDGYVSANPLHWYNTLNKTWNYPYAQGGLRHGDTVWMNMHYTNPHAIEGLFCKSRGVFNEFMVWNGFNGGRGELGDEARNSIPLENFLIGNTCIETAKNFVQHVNKTVELNWLELGYSTSEVPVVAYLDPYLAKDGHARVLLYDVGHDREFIAFHDIHMQVQTGQGTPQVNGLDVANGHRSQDRQKSNAGSVGKSDFIEGAYSHASSPYMEVTSSGPTHNHNAEGMNAAYIDYGSSFLGSTARTDNSTVKGDSIFFGDNYSKLRHQLESGGDHRSTFLDTPDGTRVIPAFLCLKGKRSQSLDLTSHTESRLQNLPHWTDMDFVRRLTLDLGEIGNADGVSDVESAVYEMVRRINQSAALQGSTLGGSSHDPAPFWDDSSFGGDKGTHMGYLRAHFGRAVKDLDGNDGYTIVIHSTVPGASGRNFCAWLDNSRGQSPYRPQFLVGHGGRFRNFWCMPIEGEDENMHPAPMPITKTGRPFAPITTLRQMVPPDDEDEVFINNLAEYGETNSRKSTEMATGRAANTVYSESFESQGDANRLIEGLRTGTRARARINFGGLVASGIPGWAPDAGVMGFGVANQGGRFDNIYSDASNTAYSAYVTTEESSMADVGRDELYGFRFTDHRGTDHTVRLVYRQRGQSFANINTVLPPSLENEVIISFDDRDVSRGGFTIGKHMKGTTYPTTLDPGGLSTTNNITEAVTWRGNEWRGVKAPANGYPIDGATFSSGTLSISLAELYHVNASSATSQDFLGLLGFPESGLFIYTDNNSGGKTTNVFRYSSRSHNSGTESTHYFYGVTGGSPDVTNLTGSGRATISPMLNWTTILTDEVIAAAMEHAMSVDPNTDSAFDCSKMYAPDGRTFEEWMGEGAKTAIQVHTLNDKNRVTPLKDLFTVSRETDWGLYAGNAEVYLSSDNIDDGVITDVGYLPHTILNITTRFRGENSNTATPLLIKSNGDPTPTKIWQQHLRGERFTAYAGDHITPCINNPTLKITSAESNKFTATPWQLLTSYDPNSMSGQDHFSEPFTVYNKSGNWARVRLYGSASSGGRFSHVLTDETFSVSSGDYISLWSGERGRLFAGNRVAGNTWGEPLTYFRGAHDSPDHSVPLYFGGGFSGVVMDINDGTQNDYTEFYSHPYSSGPTGCSGLQNVGENMGSFALLDTTAMLAMFPGTAFLNQHRGESQPPFTNADALLAPDMNVQSGSGSNLVGNTSQMVGQADESAKATIYQDDSGDVDDVDNQTAITHPTPIVLRFAHPYARYTGSDSGSSEAVAYVIFGPGQSVPKHFYGYANSGQKEPTASATVTERYTHVQGDTGVRDSGTVNGKHHPNEMSKGWKSSGTYTDRTGLYKPYLPPTMKYQKSTAYPYSILRNWEPAYASPSTWFNADFDSSSAHLITNHWAEVGGVEKKAASLMNAHPMYVLIDGSNSYHYRWHMDGGYTAGGNWFDNAVRKNPPHPTTSNILPDSQTTTIGSNTITLGLNASMFRVGSLALTSYDSSLTETGTARDVFVVDATRVQNSEELATIISAAINSYPGEGNLKALGGTFLPSFQEAIRQDRYSWINVGPMKNGGYSNSSTLTVNQLLPKYLPEKGWIRVVKAGTRVLYGKYESYTPGVSGVSTGVFTLGSNWRTGEIRLEDPTIASVTGNDHNASSIDDTYQVYVWSKTGNLRWSNGAPESLHSAPSSSNPDSHVYHHLAATQVHFNGFVDAIDRTKPVGAVGWHGERYSYLNSLKVAKTSSGYGVAAGLGAWHPTLGFSPYGSAMNAHSLNGATAIYSQSGTVATFTQDSTGLNSGLHPRHYVVVSNEAELPIIAKADRDGLILCGDMLDKRWAASNKTGGTVIASHEARHNNDRFVAYAHGGPHVDAQYATGFAPPSSGSGEWESNPPTTSEMYPMETCLFPTGDLFFDKIENAGVVHYPSEAPIRQGDILSNSLASQSSVLAAPHSHWGGKSAARNFFINHAVWKRMDGGNLCLPAPNARGLGAVPWVWRKVGSSYVKFGETIYGNTRFSFESTNAAVFPTVQAQELAHPQLASKYPVNVSAALSIPNEEIQFEAITVMDDAGQTHIIEGGSPFGTVIRDFTRVPDRDIEGPALAGSGNEPNLRINLPDPNTIPGNILVRSGFDKVQAYQHETVGSGGIQRPNLPDTVVKDNFNSLADKPSTKPFWENEGWERIDTDQTNYPDSKTGSMNNTNPLQTSYEPHDRSLYFHLTKMGWGYTEREPLGIVSNSLVHNTLTFKSVSGTVVTVNETINANIWQAEKLKENTPIRSFFTVNGHVVSFTGVSGSTFTGCEYTPGFSANDGDIMKPSFYVPAGSTRHFAARRLRDHAEVSGESPDKKPIDWMGVGTTASPASAIRNDGLTPMPIPRMGHHYVTPTMAVMPGHLSHPLYQRVYDLNRAYMSATKSIERDIGYSSVMTSLTEAANASPPSDTNLKGKEGVGVNALMWFSSTSSPHPPSDIHGGAFTLLVETKVRYDGYGILAYDSENNDGDHRLKLEAGANYSTHWHFPDPLETGAYQIIIQPNLFAQQLMGFSTNYDFGSDSGTQYPLLTDQQVATVVALDWNGSTYDFILAEALKADVRGCEVYLNEVMLDIDPSPTQQFTSLPTLALHNPLGVNESTSPVWSRKSLPYQPGMFRLASPGYTLTIPWWAPAMHTGGGTLTNGVFADSTNSTQGVSYNWRKVEHYHPEDYYHYCRTGYGSIGAQATISGYPTHFLHPYLHSYISFTPTCTIKYADRGGNYNADDTTNQILVDNNNLFPEVGKDYFNQRLVVIDDSGSEYEATYQYRGQSSGLSDSTTNRFYGVNGSTQFWAACTSGKKLRITGDYGSLGAGEIYTNKDASVAAQHIERIRGGSGDTHTHHLPDAYISMWHYNLGRPMTFYSDSRASQSSVSVDRKPYNHLPEHFETVHYHDFGYVVSDGPFDFRGFGWKSKTTNSLVEPNSMSATFDPQGRTDSDSKKYHYGSFWPGGSRFGAQASRMDLWGTAGAGWGRYWDYDRVFQESATPGQFSLVSASSISDSISSVSSKRNASFGYRFCVRAPFNRPRAALWSTQAFDDSYSNLHAGYRFGAYIQNDAVTGDIYTASISSNTSSAGTESISSGYSGIIERVTNASALIGSDLKLQQTRYSHGRRMCRPFGCAVRNIVNDPYSIRNHQGDYSAGVGSGDTDITNRRRNLAVGIAHYMTDWWGNTTGEDVRRFPVRGFGIRPAWDPEDAYAAGDRDKDATNFAAPAGHGHSRAGLDSFDPETAKRVGDRGDGRGVRWPTAFNEDLLQSVETVMDPTGIVLSTSTAQPSLGNGYRRARNDDIQLDEVPRGISRRLDVEADDGLLKPEAMAGANVEKAKNDLLPASQTLQEPISRIAPRIGLDAMTVGELTDSLPHTHVALGTEAHSLHTDRMSGRRYIVAAGVKTDTKAISDYDLTSLNFSTFKQVMRLNYTHGIWPMGGTLILDLENYMEPISDLNWGSSSGRSSNPYQSSNHDPLTAATNKTDKQIRFLLRPVRVLDHRHLEIFRDQTNALSGTAGGKYGIFTYSTPNGRAATSAKYLRSSNPSIDNPPYAPAYFFTAGGSYQAPSSTGPKIPGTEANGFVNSLKQTVGRITITNNTLQHLRADANRLGDFTVQPRYSQSLYPGTNLNKSTHSGESSHTDNEVNG